MKSNYRHLSRLIIISLLCFFSATTAFAKSSAAGSLISTGLPSLAPMLKKAMPAVVNISIQGEVKMANRDKNGREKPNAPPFKRRKFAGLGSGVVMNPEKGFIVTNAHVIKDAKTITVTLNDGRRVKAKLVGADPNSDIAVLKIKAKNLHSLPISDSSKLQVGDFVVAIGNPFGLNLYGTNQSATTGIISALQRSDINLSGFDSFIQTDAAINPGNSGGALINMKGEIIGINTAIISPYNGNVGIGLAIPINMVRDVMSQLIRYGSVHRGLMGIYVQHLTPELADAFNLSGQHGALVTQVNPSSPAERAGVRPGDIIQRINNQKVTDAAQVKNIIGLLRVGTALSIDVLRQGKKITLSTKIDDVKAHQARLQSQNPLLYGLGLEDYDQDTPMHGHVKGVQIIGALESSAGWRAGLRPGDVITDANQIKVMTLDDLQKIAGRNRKELLVHVLRGPGSIYLVINPSAL